jgi:phenylacetate-CoA ligase
VIAGIRELALRRVVLPLGGLFTGQRVMRYLSFVEQAQWWERERLDDYVDGELRRLARTAYEEVPLFRRLMTDGGVSPRDVLRRADLHRLPILTKARAREAAPGDRVRSVAGKTWDACSSGSTGENFCAKQDAATLARLRALNMAAFVWGGWPIGAEHLQTGMTLERGAIRSMKDALLGCHYESAFDLTEEHLNSMAEIILGRRLRHVRGYPGSLYYLAKRLKERGERAPMDSVVTWGDNLFPHYRELLEAVFERRVTDVYGCAEGILVAAQCEQGRYHVFATDVIMEIVDDDGLPAGPGQTGHVLLTRLHPGPQPFLRYRVGDMAIAGDDSPCPCGRSFPTFTKIEGRDTDVVLTPGGNRLIVHFFTGILEHFRDLDAFQVVQDELASCTVLVVARHADPGLEARVIEALRAKGADLTINVQRVPEIPPSASGKRRFVISSLQREQGPA